MSATLIDASALPAVSPTAGNVSDGASALLSATAGVRSAAGDATRAWAGIGSVLRSPGATDALPRAMDAVGRTASDLASAGAAVSAALEAFAVEVATVRKRRRALLADIEELRARVAASDSDDAVPHEYRADNDDLHTRARRLRAEWEQAQDDLTRVIRSQVGDGSPFLPGLGGGMIAPPLVMTDFGRVARNFGDALRLPLLKELAARGPQALEQWAAEHPDRARRLLDAPPDAETVKGWWNALSADERTALITGLSAVVGNLNGVLYADRGLANRHTLEVELPRARARYEELSARVARAEPLSVAERQEYAALAERVGALEALKRTLLASTAAAPRTIIALTLGHPPLAAVAVGNMDTATNVTVDVPGMGSSVAGSMEAWTGGAENLYNEQRKVAQQTGASRDVATVAWLGYEAPAMPLSTEVLRSTKAEAGARHLGDFLDGVAAARGWPHGEHLSVVAHSYGTTTATLAAAHTPVDNLVLLASAGVDPRVPNVGAVSVPEGHVWASQAKSDFTANVGRGAIEVPKPGFGGDQPISEANPFASNRTLVLPLPSTHPLNPGSDAWGARTFSSNDERVDGDDLPGSDGHGATPATEAALAGNPVTERGYLDAETSSIRNTAYTSLGYTPDGKKLP